MFLKNHIPTIIWSLIILALTTTPGSNVPRIQIEGLDKIVHFILFGVLMYLLVRGLAKQKEISSSPGNPYILSFIICFSFGIIIEFIQLYVPGRSYSGYDILANSAGILTAFLIFYFIAPKQIS